MIDGPPEPLRIELPIEVPPSYEVVGTAVSADELPTETLEDGTVRIDLTGLAPAPEHCLEGEPDPFNPEILVCREKELSPRLGAVYGPTEDIIFGSAVPRARLKLSESAEAQANTIKKAVGGWDADGAEVRVKLDF